MTAIKVSEPTLLTPSDYTKVRMELFEKVGTEYRVRYEAALTFLNLAVATVRGSASAGYDTLGEIQAILVELNALLDGKVDKQDIAPPALWNPLTAYTFDAEVQQYVSYINELSLDPQFNTEGFYRLLSNTTAGQSPETHPSKWAYQGQTIGEISIGDVTGLIEALNNKISVIEKAAANGVATLGADGKVPTAQLPPIGSYPFDVTQDPTGFTNPELIVVTGNADRTVTLTGTVQASWQGVIVPTLVSGYISPAHGTDTTKTYYLSYNGSVVAWNETLWAFNQLQIAIARYDATNAVWYYVRECHGLMDWHTHANLHQTVGTFKQAGGTIPSASYVLNSTTAANRRPNVDLTVILDEDLLTSNAALTSKSYTQFRLGVAGADVNTLAAADIVSLSTNNPYYNPFSTPNWVQTLMPANSIATVWVSARQMAADANSQKYRFEFVQPQWITQANNSNPGSITAAVDAEKLRLSSELNIGGLATVENIFIAKVIIVFTGGNWTIHEVIQLTGSKYSQIGSPSGNFLSTVAVDGTTIAGNGTPSSPLNYVGTVAIPNIIANKGVGLSAAKPVTGLTVGDVFVSIDSKLKFTATGATTWNAGVALTSGVFINDTLTAVNLLYQYDGTNVKVTGDGGSSGAGGHTIQENAVSLTARTKLNFVSANSEDHVQDDAGNDASKYIPTIKGMNDFNATGLAASDLIGRNAGNTGFEPKQVAPFVDIVRSSEANKNVNEILSTYIPAGYKIDSILIKNQTANASGNISIGTAAAGTQIVNAATIGASAVVDCTLVEDFFSDVNDTDLYISSSAWGTGVVTVYFTFKKLI